MDCLERQQELIQIKYLHPQANYRDFNMFLLNHAPVVSEEIAQMYILTMQKVYVQQFKAYTTSLGKLQLEWSANSYDLLYISPELEKS